jgi:2-polyprenyl-3-methyl-5-hydroxy-6-metoxy-1,4-benzoquinol methylase
VTPQQTASAYDKIARYWDHPGFDYSYGIAQHERALGFLSTFGSALDVGCGSSGRIIDLLLESGLEVQALDLSEEMLKRARKHHPELEFHHADICTWEFHQGFDFISAWDSIWHVPLQQQADVIRKLCNGLSQRGVLIFSTGGVYEPNEVTNPCFGEPLYHAAPGIPAILRTIEDSACHCRHLEFDGGPDDKHAYLIVQHV